MKIQRASFIPLLLLTIFLCVGARDVRAEIIIRAPNNLGLVGYWSFDEMQGTHVSDMSGSKNDGTIQNGAAWGNGKFGGALSVNGTSNQHVVIEDNSSFDLGPDGFTYAAWIKPSAFPHEYNMFMGHYLPYFNVRSNQKLHMSMQAAGAQRSVLGDTDLETGVWYHVAATYDEDGYMRVYLNGVEDGVAGPYPVATTVGAKMYIGKWQASSSYQFTGEIDEVRVYNRALSDEEIETLYGDSKETVVGEVSSGHYSDDLVAHYTFDGSTISGSTLSDAAGDNDGTISSGPSPRIGRVGQAMEFNSSGDNVNLGNPSDLQMSGDQTIAMWLYPYNFSARRNPYEKAYGGEGTITQETNGHLNYYYGTNGGNSTPYQGFNSNSSLTLNAWNHIAIVRDLSANPRRLYWYINGVQTSSASATYAAATTGTRSAQIGRGYAGQYNGLIDDLRIYNRALSAEEVQGLAGGGTGVLEVTDLNEKGSILMERWTGIGGTSLSGFPPATDPDHTEERTSFEAPTGWGDNYGVRMRGYLYPETSGNYTFWLATDDNGELWLSTNSNPANKVRIARVTSWASSRQWNKEANQKSVEIPLVAGQRYYIEALMKEGGGGDNMAVSWKLNDTSNPANGNGDYIIPGSVLSPWYE